MTAKCCINTCINTESLNHNKKNPEIKFYRFPGDSRSKTWQENRRELWLSAVKSHV